MSVAVPGKLLIPRTGGDMKFDTKNTVKLLLFTLLLTSLYGCQKPEKKASDASVYNEGVNNLEILAQSLKLKGLDLDSDKIAEMVAHFDPKKGHRTFPKIRDYLAPRVSIDVVKSELTQFVIAADKLLALGTSKTVVFPEKEKIMKRNYLASFFLADIFHNQKLKSDFDPSPISQTVDHHEFELRFARFSLNLKKLKNAGFPIGDRTYSFTYSNKKALWAINLYNQSIEDVIRMNSLLDRNNNFQSESYGIFSKSFLPMAGYFYNIVEELKRATGRSNSRY